MRSSTFITIKPRSFHHWVLGISSVAMKNQLKWKQRRKEQEQIICCRVSLTENSNCASLKIDVLAVTDADNFF